MNKRIIFVLTGLFTFISIANAGINLLTTPTGTEVIFDSQTLKEPIGCIYIDNQYLSRLSADEIQTGKSVIETNKLLEKLHDTNFFQVTIFIEGFSGKVLIRKDLAGFFVHNPSRTENIFDYFGEGDIDSKLQKFVTLRFTELRRIRTKIIAEGAQWKANLTSVFMLPDEDREKLCGFRPPSGGMKGTPIQPKGSGLRFPPELDWTNMDGINWMTKVKNQSDPRPAGTCWAFGTVGQIEALINIVEQNPDPYFDLAEQTLVSDCCRYCGDCDGGMNFWALHYIRNNGIPLESVDPYTAKNYPCDKRPSKVRKIQSYSKVTWKDNNENVIKNALQHHPLSTAVYVDDGWYSYTGDVYSYTGSAAGPNHCVVFVGWNDNDEGGTQTWKIKNSWGEDWGDNGYMRLIRGQPNRCGWFSYDAEY